MSNNSDTLRDLSNEGEHNYCRSSNDNSLGAWCYTTEPSIIWQYCSCLVFNSGKENFDKSFIYNISKFPKSALQRIGLMQLVTHARIISIKIIAVYMENMVTVGLVIMEPLIIGAAMDIPL